MSDTNKPAHNVLGSSTLDFLMAGGASVILFGLVMVSANRQAPDSATGWFIYYLSFAVNFPHFLASYQILYFDFRKKVTKTIPFVWAGLALPLMLLLCITAGIYSSDTASLGHLIQIMYFTVGWHYIKQILGVMIVLNGRRQIYFSADERFWLKSHLFSLWGLSFINANLNGQTFYLEGLSYQSLALPGWTWTMAQSFFAVTLVMTLYLAIKKWIREGRLVTWPAASALLALYCWYIPAFHHPLYALMIPFFHSLQYLLFVFAFKLNETRSRFGAPTSPESRQNWVRHFFVYCFTFFISGGIFMYALPRWLDSTVRLSESLGPSPFMFAFTVFINIHHYFIDNVLWRAHQPEMQNYLFKPKA